MPKKIYKRFLILLRIILSMIKTSFRDKKVWTNSYKLSPKSSFSILLSFDCHLIKNEPRNAVNSAFLGSCTLFKLGKLLFCLKLFCLSFICNMPIHYFIYTIYFGLLIFCCQSVAIKYYSTDYKSINRMWHLLLNICGIQDQKHTF